MTFEAVDSGKWWEWTFEYSGLRNEWGMRTLSCCVLIVSGREGELIHLERGIGLEIVV